MDVRVRERLVAIFAEHFGGAPSLVAYAPGRVEILGNHTDYNEGYVLSAAINRGTWFAVRRTTGRQCRLVAGDLRQEAVFDAADPQPCAEAPWANYGIGVWAGLKERLPAGAAVEAAFLGDIPLGGGLSSSAALEMSTGMALAGLFGIEVPRLDLARIGQAAEHRYAGVRCGLLDQISSLCGREHALVMTDFRTLQVETVPMADSVVFLIFNTHVKHRLVDSAYNERRERCEAAVGEFARLLERPVRALRDVSWPEWEREASRMDPVTARRAAHVIGENQRVLQGRERLRSGDLPGFGRLMFESHESSRLNFENSCPELDALVQAARGTSGVLGARLSGGGFGGSAVVLVEAAAADAAVRRIRQAYEASVGQPCDELTVVPSQGARHSV